MRNLLSSRGYSVHVLDYNGESGDGLQRRRLNYYVSQVNRYNPHNSVFVDIHVNSARNRDASGTRVYVPSPMADNPKSVELGGNIKQRLNQTF